jgi:hypothetical protein
VVKVEGPKGAGFWAVAIGKHKILGLDLCEIAYLVCGMINRPVSSFRRYAQVFSVGVLILFVSGIAADLQATTAPPFADLRGTYRGIERIVIKKNGKRTLLSAPVKAVARLSRGKKALQIKVEGNFILNNRRGKITSEYSITENGRAVLRLRDELTGAAIQAKGTGNLRSKGGRFTMLGRGYGLTGVLNGNLRLKGRSLQIRQILRDGTDTVTFSIVLSRRTQN